MEDPETQQHEPSRQETRSYSSLDDCNSLSTNHELNPGETDISISSPVPVLSQENPIHLEQILLFGCGLGSSLCYIATLSSLVYFKLHYGATSYVDLNLAVYLPLLPISLAQAKWDQYIDSIFQSRPSYLFRGLISFGLCIWGTVAMTVQDSLISLIWNAVLQGTGGAILYGTLNQLASFLGNDARQRSRAKATVSAGVQASAMVVLGVSLLSGFGSYNKDRFPTFLWMIASIECICLVMFLWLLSKQPSVQASMIHRDSSLQLSIVHDEDSGDDNADVGRSDIEEPLLLNDSSNGNFGNGVVSYRMLLGYSKTCCFILVLNLIPSFLVGSWFTQVPTEWVRLPQILFYIRIAADFLGRLTTILVPPKSIACLRCAALVRLFPVIVFFWLSKGDELFIVLVAIIAFLSGYIVTGCFQLAPQCLPRELRTDNLLAKQASLLTVAFSVAAIGGLVASFLLIAIGL